MSIFDNIFDPITQKVLKEMGFSKCFWGSPFKWDKKRGATAQSRKESTAWELYVDSDRSDIWSASGTMYYFPKEFKGYVTRFALKNESAAGRVLGWRNDLGDSWGITVTVNNRLDLEHAIMKFKEYLKQN